MLPPGWPYQCLISCALLTEGNVTLQQVVLGRIRKEVEQALRGKEVGSTPRLLQLQFLPQFPRMMDYK